MARTDLREAATGETLTLINSSANPIPWIRWISACLSLGLLALGIHILMGGTTGDPERDSPWPYLALGSLLAVRALVPRRQRSDGQP